MTISEEKRKWMEEVGIREFKHPMKYHIYGWLLISVIINIFIVVIKLRHI